MSLPPGILWSNNCCSYIVVDVWHTGSWWQWWCSWWGDQKIRSWRHMLMGHHSPVSHTITNMDNEHMNTLPLVSCTPMYHQMGPGKTITHCKFSILNCGLRGFLHLLVISIVLFIIWIPWLCLIISVKMCDMMRVAEEMNVSQCFTSYPSKSW